MKASNTKNHTRMVGNEICNKRDVAPPDNSRGRQPGLFAGVEISPAMIDRGSSLVKMKGTPLTPNEPFKVFQQTLSQALFSK